MNRTLSHPFGYARLVQSGTLLDQGTNGLTIVRDGKIIFYGTEDTEPVQ
ncbi:MAG TPA: hypothetical protein VFQ23_04315 [Anaerolineales bacterium]|nr:hypothetical protein [Anaerolineales bacterium]